MSTGLYTLILGLTVCLSTAGQPTESTELTDDFSTLQVATGKAAKKTLENPKSPCQQPRPKAVFCYAKVRTPPEPTVSLLANQLHSACDGWALLGDTDDPTNNVTKAFSREDSPDVFKKGRQDAMSSPLHDINDLMTRSIWTHLIEAGVLDEYEWILKVDADSFVRPSTLRNKFKALHTSCRRNPISSEQDGVDGFFLAVQADTIAAIKSLDWPSECSIVLSGDVWSVQNHDNDIQSCLAKIGVSHVERIKDATGNDLLALDQEHLDPPVGTARGPKECEKIADLLLERAHRHIRGPLCGCSPIWGEAPGCVSEDFVSVHHVKDELTYAKLVEAFP